MMSDIMNVRRRMTSRPSTSLSASDFVSPLTTRGAMPLRVAVYEVVAGAIRNGTVATGALLPPEADLGSAFQVSRTVMREALILLEEDGLIRTQRGVGRFVTDLVPEIGIEVLRPFEEMLGTSDSAVSVRRVESKVELVTDFTERWLDLHGATSRMWESVISRDGEPIALAQEWVAESDAGLWLGAAAPSAATTERAPVSMLATLQAGLRSSLGPGMCHISMTNAGADRAHLLNLRPRAWLLLLTQTVARDGRPFFVAKVLIRPEAAHLTVVQS